MLLITKGESKYWYLTLSEKTTIANPYYLFSLTHRQTNKIYNFILTDISTYKERYNKFAIDESIYEFFEGEYIYQIFAQTSSTNVNPLLANQLVETGVLKIQPSLSGVQQYTPSLIEKMYNGVVTISHLLTEANQNLITEDNYKIIL